VMTEADIPVYEVDEEPFVIDDEDPDYLDKMKLVYYTNLTSQELDDCEKNPFQGNNIDKIMKEPFIKIKIKNLYNFKVQPLEHYDLEILKENDPAALYKTSGIDKGYSKFLSEKGKLEWRPCEIVDFDEKYQLFIIRWRHDGSLKKVTRLNFMYAFEQEHEFEERLKNALENRYRNLYLQSYDRKNKKSLLRFRNAR
jgi:hypothetical protein